MSEGKERVHAAAYIALYPRLSEKAAEHGYALAIHGSFARDMDVIAVPWTAEASDAETLVRELVAHIRQLWMADDGAWMVVATPPEPRPHGRVTWSITLGAEAFVDISVMPRVTP